MTKGQGQCLFLSENYPKKFYKYFSYGCANDPSAIKGISSADKDKITPTNQTKRSGNYQSEIW
jgi:hypothetical protein